jgi:hypothetical protein
MMKFIRKHFERGGVPALLQPYENVVTTHQEAILLAGGTATAEPEAESGEAWEFGGAELFFENGAVEIDADDQMVVKEIMRTGEYPVTPGSTGRIRKPMKIVKEGPSSAKDHTISLSELVENFEAGAYPNVTIPLSDTIKDHNNLTRNNTGFVKKLFTKDRPDGKTSLYAKMHFTEPEVRGKVDRGTIPDVSGGVYFDVETPEGKRFGSALNHVCLTKNPFIRGMEPFGVMASDDENAPDVPEEIEGFVMAETAEEKPDWDDRMSFSHQRDAAQAAISEQLNLSGDDYEVTDIAPERAVIRNKLSDISWVAGFELTGDGLRLDPVGDWQIREKSVVKEGTERDDEPAPAPKGVEASADDPDSEKDKPKVELSPIAQAQEARRTRARDREHTRGGEAMPGINLADPLEGVDLSDPEAVKARAEAIASEAAELRKASRSGEIGEKVEKLKALFSDDEETQQKIVPLVRVYRDILMSDDEQPAAVLLSHDDDGNVTSKKQVTATEIADKIFAAMPSEEKDGKTRIMLAAQATDDGNNEPPPQGDEDKDEETRTKEVADSLGMSDKMSTSNNREE